MATATPDPMPATSIEGEQCITLHGVDWAGYRAMLRVRGERSVPKMLYLDGELWLMSPSFFHEQLEKRLGFLVLIVAEELDIACSPSGHTTFRRRKKRAGVEGDETFYFANEPRIRGKDEIDLRFDPPPDLAIEAVHTNPAEPAVAIWRRFRTPEIWTCDAERLRILVRRANGHYVESETSASLPILNVSEIFAWVKRPRATRETEWIKDVRRWARTTLLPRLGNQDRP